MAEAESPAGGDPRIGRLIGDRYRLLEIIGEGGMGTVFRAEHVLMKKTVAVKLLHAALGKVEDIARRFEREAQSASRIEHPGIIRVTDFGRTERGELFLVMEHVIGESLARVIEERRLPLPRAVALMVEVCRALEHAHAMGVVHRDLKPENIMICRREDPRDREGVKLLDFGIAKMNDDTDGVKPLTQAGVVFGTPHYMSPEQAIGEPTDHRSDIYSCGVILYEVVTGRRPFVADQAVAVISQHLTMDPTPPRKAAPQAGISAALEAVVLRALAKKKDARHQTMTELRAALEAAMGAGPPAGPRRVTRRLDLDAMRSRARAGWQRLGPTGRKLALGGTGLVAVVAAVLALRGGGGGGLEPRAPSRAEAEKLKPAEEALSRGDLVTARAVLMQALAAMPQSARVHYLIGNVDYLERDYDDTLKQYREAIRLDAGYRGDFVLKHNVSDLVSERRTARAALDFLVRDVGAPGCRTIAQIASSDRRSEIRQTARAAAEQLGCGNEIDRFQSYLLDFSQLKECEERREALLKLRQLGDRRALDPLKKARKRSGGFFGELFGGSTECMKQDLEDAIAELEAR